MGHRLAMDEANTETIPTWLAEKVLEDGEWPLTLRDKPTTIEASLSPVPEQVTRRERMLLMNLVRARRQAETARVQLDAIEGIGGL